MSLYAYYPVEMAMGTNPSSLAFSDTYPLKKILPQVNHVMSRLEILSQTQTHRVKKIHRVTHLKFLT
jgi:hypothetical protein